MIRKRRGLSVEAAAGLAKISKSYLSMLENGLRRFERQGLLEDLAGALGCAVTELSMRYVIHLTDPARRPP